MEGIEDIVKAVEASKKELAEAVSRQNAELAENKRVSEATAQAIKSANDRLEAAVAEFDKKSKEIDSENSDLKNRISELEKMGKRTPFGAGDTETKSAGESFAEFLSSDARRLEEVKRSRRSPSFNVKNLHFKASPILSSDATRMVVPMRDSMVLMPQRPLRIKDMMERIPIASNSAEYIEVIGVTEDAALAVTSITRSGSTATLTTTAAAHGLQPGDVVKVAGADQAAYNVVARVLTVTAANAFTYAVSGTPDTPATGTITYYNYSAHGAAAETAEGNSKPEAKFVWNLRTATVQTIPHYVVASRQVLDDMPQLSALVDGELSYGVDFRIEKQLLYGDGSSPNLQGIMVHSSVQSLTGASPETKVDVIRKAATKVMQSEFEADVCVINPADWESIEIAKGSDEHYLWQGVQMADGITRLWRLPIIVTKSILPGDALVGSFRLGATWYDRQDVSVRISDHVFFTSNKVVVLAEARGAAAWKRPEAFCAIDFGTAV